MCSPQYPSLFTLVMKFHDRQSSERCIRKLISRHCLDKTRTRWNEYLFLITYDRDFRPQTCTNGLVFREYKHIKNIFEDVYFTKNSFHITLNVVCDAGSTQTHLSLLHIYQLELSLFELSTSTRKCFFYSQILVIYIDR